MKLSFSTLGCPEWSWNEIIATAKDMGFDGVEIRGVGKELYAPAIKEFTSDYIDDTKKKLNDTGIEIICLASACYLYDKEKTEKFIAEGHFAAGSMLPKMQAAVKAVSEDGYDFAYIHVEAPRK